jgi:hypothetical protein
MLTKEQRDAIRARNSVHLYGRGAFDDINALLSALEAETARVDMYERAIRCYCAVCINDADCIMQGKTVNCKHWKFDINRFAADGDIPYSEDTESCKYCKDGITEDVLGDYCRFCPSCGKAQSDLRFIPIPDFKAGPAALSAAKSLQWILNNIENEGPGTFTGALHLYVREAIKIIERKVDDEE